MRTVLIGLVIVLFVFSCGMTVRYGQVANYAQKQLNGERYKRISAEENLQKANTQISSLKGELEKAQNKVGQMETVLEKTKAVNEDLKTRLDKASEIKTTLENKIAELQKLVSPM